MRPGKLHVNKLKPPQSFSQGAQRGERPLETRRLIVLVQVTLECKRLVASFALIVLEGWVCLHVSTQVRPVSKRFATVRTPKRLLPRVRAHVALQQPRPAERFAAHVALVLEVVGQEVHGHRWHGDVHFPTCGALLSHLAVYAPVRLLVPAQVGGCGVGFTTLTAGVPLGSSPQGSRGFPSWSSVHDEKRIHAVSFTHSCVAVDVSPGWWRNFGPGTVWLVRIAMDITMDITMDARICVVDAAIDDRWVARGGYFRDDWWIASNHIVVRIRTQIITDVAWRDKERGKSLWQEDWLAWNLHEWLLQSLNRVKRDIWVLANLSLTKT